MHLTEIATHIRAMQLFTHTAHNLVRGPLFYADHDVLGDFYKQMAKDYDGVIERAIHNEGPEAADLTKQLKKIYKKLKEYPCNEQKENKTFFEKILKLEEELCELISSTISEGVSPGVEQLIGDIGNRSNIRQYLISQRLK